MGTSRILAGEADIFVGRRARLRRYLVCALQGYFPVLVKTGPNALAAIYRTGAPHVGITGTLAVSTSADGGQSWTDPVEIQPRGDDNRNPALGVNARGELIAAYWKAGVHSYAEDAQGTGLRYAGKPNETWKTVPGLYVCRSADQGRTWGQPQPYMSQRLSLASPYGRIITAPNGALLMPVYGAARESIPGVRDVSILLRSRDGGETWGDESLVGVGLNEISYAFLPDGRLLAAARTEKENVATLFSTDLGYTWSDPQPLTRVREHPADLTVLASGKVLLTFGRRVRPMGCGALLSADGGKTWDTAHEVLLAGDGVESGDLGYPSTVQLDDGHIVTVLYYASGSEMSEPYYGWGSVSCQAIHYREEDICPEK
jgi:sialidase-1